jgi:transposase-like protein
MSSVTEEDGMAKRASQAGDARTSDRTSALRLGTELSTCGKRRRWMPEQKHKIVAEGMEPDVSAAIVAGRHGISTGQFYAWRQQLLLRGALDARADSVPNLASIDATTSVLRVEPAIPAPPEPGTPTAAAAPVAPVQPDDRVGVTRPDGVAGRLDEDCGVEHALTTDRRSVLNSPRGARADCGQADRSDDTAPAGAWTYALRRFRHWDRVGRIGWSPVPGEQLLKLVALGAAGDQTFEHVGQVGEWIDAVQFCCADQGQCNSPMVSGAVRTTEQGVLPSHCDPLHAALDNIGVDLQPPVIKEQYQARPVPQRVADGVRQRRGARHARQCGFQPGLQGLNDRTAALLADGAAVLGRLAADLGLDRVEPGDLSQCLSGERRLGRRVELVEASPAMCLIWCTR